MGDSEIIDLAARAAGVELQDCSCGRRCIRYGIRVHHWNPLNDDGDALRLAVKLQMDVDIEQITADHMHVFAMSRHDNGSGVSLQCGLHEIEQTTRRAISLAAAAVVPNA